MKINKLNNNLKNCKFKLIYQNNIKKLLINYKKVILQNKNQLASLIKFIVYFNFLILIFVLQMEIKK